MPVKSARSARGVRAGGAAGWTSAAGAVLDLFLGGAIVHRGLDSCNPPDTVVVDGSRDAPSWLADAQLADARVATPRIYMHAFWYS